MTYLDLIFEYDIVDDFESYKKNYDFWTIDEDGKYIFMTYRTNFKPLFPKVEDANENTKGYFDTLFKNNCGYAHVWTDMKPVFIEYSHIRKFQMAELSIQDKAWMWGFFARRPYMRLRGKPITEEQVFDIVSKTDSFLGYCHSIEDRIHFFHLGNSWFETCGGNLEGHGFIHPNGVVGFNGVSLCKNPEFDEVLDDTFKLVTNFPYLDLVYVFTYWDEVPPETLDKFYDRTGKYTEDDIYEGFYGAIELGVHIHDGKVEILDDDSASKVYKQYEKQYEVSESYIYSQYFRNEKENRKMHYFDEDFLRRCIEAHGLDFEKTKASIRDKNYPFPKNKET